MTNCSFCGKHESQVFLIIGPQVCICNECVSQCVHVLNARKPKEQEQGDPEAP